jgi:hypothetical protein
LAAIQRLTGLPPWASFLETISFSSSPVGAPPSSRSQWPPAGSTIPSAAPSAGHSKRSSAHHRGHAHPRGRTEQDWCEGQRHDLPDRRLRKHDRDTQAPALPAPPARQPEAEALLSERGLSRPDLDQALAELAQTEGIAIWTIVGINDDGLFGSRREGWHADLPDACAEPFIPLLWLQVLELLGRVPKGSTAKFRANGTLPD